MKPTEEFLHFVWQNKLFNQAGLKVNMQPLQIMHQGTSNPYSGPDFSFAKIKIGTTQWVGNVEIHINTSDWYKHNHQTDPAYNNVILHVVFNHDLDDQKLPPVLELKHILFKHVYHNYLAIKKSQKWLPCHTLFQNTNPIKNNMWFERLVVQRLEKKVAKIEEWYNFFEKDLEQTFFTALATGFGLKANKSAFEDLAKSVSIHTLLKYKGLNFVVEAILFGQAGFLGNNEDEYAKNLKKEYDFYKEKHNLKSLSRVIWKTGGVRPPNLPTLKIAQFSSLIENIFPISDIIQDLKPKDIINKFHSIPSEYWDNHFVFGKEVKASKRSLGATTINSLVINTVVPFLFFVGKHRDNYELKEKAIELLDQIPPEKNSIIKNWENYNLEIKTSKQTQALIEQRNSYCVNLHCLHCGIGNQIIKGEF